VNDPLQYKRSIVRPRRRWPYVLTLLIVIAGGLAYGVFFTPFFRVQDIRIEYASRPAGEGALVLPIHSLDEEARAALTLNIIAFLQSSNFRLFSLLGEEFTLAWPSTTLPPEFLTAKAPYATNIRIQRSFFDRLVRIVITPRNPVGIWCSLELIPEVGGMSTSTDPGNGQKKCWWFDREGVAGEAAPATSGNLTINVQDSSGFDASVDRMILDAIQLRNFLKILDILKEAEIEIRSFTLNDRRLQEIETSAIASMPRLHFSLRNDPSFALSALEELKKIGLNKLNYADLRVAGRVYYTTK